MRFAMVILLSLLCFCNSAFSQKAIIVSGTVKGAEAGTKILLMKQEGNVGTQVAKDSIINGSFRLEYTPETGEVEQYSLMADGEGFPPMTLKLWGKAGHKVEVEGNDKYIYTWNVKSDIPQQKEWSYFINANRELWNTSQKLSAQRSAMVARYLADDCTAAERKQLKAGMDSLDALSDGIDYNIQKKNLALLQTGKVTAVRLGILKSVTNSIKWNKTEAFRPGVEKLYSSLSADMRNSADGQEIALTLHPPKVVKTGEPLYDTLLRDLSNNSYHLADFKGKYILLDFWSFGCGPCHASVPEMKAIHERFKDSLTIVSLSSDNRKMWEKATDVFKMSWLNLSDGAETRGIYAHYGVEGIPNYVLIDRDGIVKATWTGYGTGSLKKKIMEHTGLAFPSDNSGQ